MKCPLCNKENPHHMENWGGEKVIVWTLICEDCLDKIKYKNYKKVV